MIVCIGKIEPIPPICVGTGFICGKTCVCNPGAAALSLTLSANSLKNDIFYEGLAWPLKVSITLYITSIPLSLSSSKLGTKLMIPPGSVCIS